MIRNYRGSEPNLKQYFKAEELTANEKTIYVKLNQTIKKVTESSERLQLNTAISALMELIRDFDSDKITNDTLNDQIVLKTIQMVAPMAPHLAEEMWETAGFSESVFRSRWPEYDESAVIGERIEIAVQVNGKLRESVMVPADADQAAVEKAAFASSKVQTHTEGKAIVKKIYVKGRLLNIVVKG